MAHQCDVALASCFLLTGWRALLSCEGLRGAPDGVNVLCILDSLHSIAWYRTKRLCSRVEDDLG